MRVYLDTCCYSRLFDDRSNIGNYLERESILLIFEQVYAGNIEIIGSKVLEEEICKIKDYKLFDEVINSYETIVSKSVGLKNSILKFSAILEKTVRLKLFDALHMTCGMAMANYLITTDIKFIKNGNKLRNLINIINPIEFMTEVVNGKNKE